MTTKNFRIASALFLLLYLVIRFGFEKQLYAWGAYASYFFELGIVLASFLIYRSHVRLGVLAPKTLGLDALFGLAGGFLAIKISGIFSIQIPWDLQGMDVLFFLLIVGPILEEALFRFALWEPISALQASPAVTWLATSALFAFGHLFAYWQVPEEIRPFVLYQTAYVLLLGLYCGYRRWSSGGLPAAIWVHFCFNLGFYLGYLT